MHSVEKLLRFAFVFRSDSGGEIAQIPKKGRGKCKMLAL